MLLPKGKREERAIANFLKYFNNETGSSYQVKEWLDRGNQQGPIPDCLCEDSASGANIVIEHTILASTEDLRLSQGTAKFLGEVRCRLNCRLPGVFLLHDWEVDEIEYSTNERDSKIDQFCQEIMEVTTTLSDGEVAQLHQLFRVKLRKEEAHRVTADCALVYTPLCGNPSLHGEKLINKFEDILKEANSKFENYTSAPTFLLVSIWETGLDYRGFETELQGRLDMSEYPNVNNIYLSEGDPRCLVYRFWPSNV